MGKPAAPQIPSAQQTASAQTGTNIATAIANANLNNVNQVGPNGSLTYTQSGTKSFTDPSTGQTYQLPQFTATTSLSPDQQKLYDQQNQLGQGLNQLAIDQTGKLSGLLGTNVDLSAANLDNYTNTHFLDDFNKQWDRNQSSLETQLANKGIALGSDAYTRALGDFNTSKASAWDNLLGDQQNSARTAVLAERNQPINEITALMSGGQVQMPTFASTGGTSIPTTDYAGLLQQQYANQYGQYANQQAQSNQLLGGLFGLGSNLLMLSDRRAKENVHKIGITKDGQPIYIFNYKGDQRPQIGLMAQDVEKTHPEAVHTLPGGLKAVDYGAALKEAV